VVRQGKVAMLRGVRAQARVTGDRALVAAMTADLERMGVRDDAPLETVVPEPREKAVPRKGGRPKLPRCEHGRIVGRCDECPNPRGETCPD
jgi:hypothetical protein